MSDFVLHAAKQNGLAVLAGSTSAGVFPGFASAADWVFRFCGANAVFVLRHRSREWIQAFLSAEKAASLFV